MKCVIVAEFPLFSGNLMLAALSMPLALDVLSLTNLATASTICCWLY